MSISLNYHADPSTHGNYLADNSIHFNHPVDLSIYLKYLKSLKEGTCVALTKFMKTSKHFLKAYLPEGFRVPNAKIGIINWFYRSTRETNQSLKG